MIVENKYIISDSQVNDANEFRTQELFEILTEMGGIHSEKIGNGRNVLMSKKLSWVLLTWKIKFITYINYFCCNYICFYFCRI